VDELQRCHSTEPGGTPEAPKLDRAQVLAGEASLRAAIPGAYLRRLDAAGVTVTDALGGSR
jgi:hypothetical protein